MQTRIENLTAKKLIGMSLETSLVENKTVQLFKTFMPRKKEIQNVKSKDVFDIRVYPNDYYANFSPAATFTKWAAVEVSTLEELPNGMQPIILTGGKYAVFTIKSADSTPNTFQYIFTQWLPNSIYKLADRPHFDILGEKTQQRAPEAEEEIWIPIQLKA